MTDSLKSLLAGIACAGLLVLPSLAEAPASSRYDNGDGGHLPLRTYTARSLKVDRIVGTLIVTVSSSGPMTVEAWGSEGGLDRLNVAVHDSRLDVDAAGSDDDRSVWDWHHWFDFSEAAAPSTHDLTVRVGVPRGTEVAVENLVGNASIGDTQGDLKIEASAAQAKIGHVASAKLALGGSGKLEIAGVTGPLRVAVGGAGKIVTGPVGSVKASIAGSGDARFGPIAGGLDVDIAGAGDVFSPRINGPANVAIAGSGSVKIADGIADPLHVEILGTGNFDFGGVAVDPHVEALGSGNVRIRAYRGHLSSEGMADVKIGD